MLEKVGCTDVTVDAGSNTATVKVPATVTDEMITKAVGGKFGAKVNQ